MGRQKQVNPRRSGALLIENNGSTGPLDTKVAAGKRKTVKGQVGDKEKPFYIEIDRTG